MPLFPSLFAELEGFLELDLGDFKLPVGLHPVGRDGGGENDAAHPVTAVPGEVAGNSTTTIENPTRVASVSSSASRRV
ncbi:hypothetical protein ACOM2C_10755 [Pseudarthrobacter sp. So.54]